MTVIASGTESGESRFDRGLLALARIGVAHMWIQNVAWQVPSDDFGALRH